MDKFSHNSFVISLAAFQSGKFIIAEDNLEKIYKKDNSDNTVIHLLALTKAALKKELEAASLFHILHQRNPKDLSILYNLATALMESGKYEESIQSFTKLSKFSINKPEIWLNFGKALSKLNKHKEAIAKYDEVLSIEPNNIHALYNKAVSYNQLTIYEEVQPILDKLLLIDKNNPFVHSLCGSLLFRKGLLEESLLAYQKANELNPNNALLWADIGVTLRSLNRLEESLISFKKALELEPDLDFLLGDYLHTKMRLCDWSDFDSDLQKCIDGIESAKAVIYPFPLLSLTDSPELELKCAQIYSQKHFQNIVAQPFLKPKIQPNGKIKVAYLSPDFRDHAVSQLIVEVLELHDKQHFEIYGFYFGPSTNDDMHHRIASTFNEFHSVAHLSDQAICDLIRSKEIDIAVDLAGHTQYNRAGILARRCAPIQINYLGYPGTMGASFIDYIIADSMVIPEDTYQYYSEKIINMPFTYQANSSRPALTEQSISRKDYGIDEDAFVFCCFNNSYKYNPHVFNLWGTILNSKNNCCLLLISDTKLVEDNIKKEFLRRNVALKKIIFLNRTTYQTYLSYYGLADLFLDTTPFNAGTTASDALWCGVPVLTHAGFSFTGRMAASLLNSINLSELITHSDTDYVNKAIELIENKDTLVSIKQQLSRVKNSSFLFNTKVFTGFVEEAFRECLKKDPLQYYD